MPNLLWDLPLALALLTRLPLPRLPDEAFKAAARATWSYPLVGLVVGAIATAVWWVTSPLGPALSAGFALLSMVFATGALHEDGLADSADGLWGGQTPERRLEIMKDSRIGSYGVLALVFGIGLRWQALVALGDILALLVAAIVSRAVLPSLMALFPQARQNGLAASVGRPPKAAACAALAIGFIAASMVLPLPMAACVLLLGLLAAATVAIIAYRKLRGVTGDILGASQQIAELSILCALAFL